MKGARDTATRVASRARRWGRVPSMWSPMKEQLGQPASHLGPNMKWYTINWLRPAKSSERVRLPPGPSKV